jgi:hypothetical protein
MNKNIVLALLAGLFGGMLTRYIQPHAVLAQNQTQVARVIRAQSFTLVDSQDRTVATFIADNGRGLVPRGPDGQPAPPDERARIILRDSRGRVIWTAGGIGLLPLSQR